MKNRTVAFVITGVIAVGGLSAHAQESKKTASAPKTAAIKPDLKEVKIDSAVDFQRFKKESELRINENMSKIAELKAKKSSDREVQRVIDKKVFDIELRNNILKKKIRNAGDTKTNRWVSFKQSFNHDMEELEATIKSF